MNDKIKTLDDYVKQMIEVHNSKYLCLTNFLDFNLIFKTNNNYSVSLFNIMSAILNKVLVNIEEVDNYLEITTNSAEYVLIDYSNNVVE